MNKESKKLYLPVKNKTNLSRNWKTKLNQGANWVIKKIKVIIMLRGKERKNRYAKLDRSK